MSAVQEGETQFGVLHKQERIPEGVGFFVQWPFDPVLRSASAESRELSSEGLVVEMCDLQYGLIKMATARVGEHSPREKLDALLSGNNYLSGLMSYMSKERARKYPQDQLGSALLYAVEYLHPHEMWMEYIETEFDTNRGFNGQGEYTESAMSPHADRPLTYAGWIAERQAREQRRIERRVREEQEEEARVIYCATTQTAADFVQSVGDRRGLRRAIYVPGQQVFTRSRRMNTSKFRLEK